MLIIDMLAQYADVEKYWYRTQSDITMVEDNTILIWPQQPKCMHVL